MTGEALSGSDRAARADAVATLSALFEAEGHAPVDLPNLMDADLLLDLYGEDIRTRALLFPEPVQGGEICLRPDFTVPVLVHHARGGWDRRAAYAYAGPVFRIQDRAEGRPVEYLQAGVERYGEPDRAAADARVLGLVLRGLEALDAGPLAVRTGDPGLFFALLEALSLSPPREAALRRHFWRPARFRALIERFTAPEPSPGPTRTRLLEAAAEGAQAVQALAADGRVPVGARGLDEVAARALGLAAAAEEPPMPAGTAELIRAVLGVRGPSGAALARIAALTADAGIDIRPAIETFEIRLDALNRIGIDAEELPFDAGFGRNMEYYDGFVFEIAAEGAAGLPPLAGGGRYDRMTQRLGAGRAVPALGAMIRPEAVLQARAGGGSP